MPRNADVSLAPGVWTEITANTAIAVSVQNKSGYSVTLMAMTSTTLPAGSSRDGFILMPWQDGLYTLSQSFPGLTAPVRMAAIADGPATIFVSHD